MMAKNRKVTILMYHYVRLLKDSRYPDIKGLEFDLFRSQLAYLQKHYTFIRVEELIHATETGDSLPPKAVLLTFNDCYIDHFKNVFPLLNEKGIQGAFYPEIATIEEQKVLLNHKIHFILAEARDKFAVVRVIFSRLDKLRNEYKLDPKEHYFDKLAVASKYDSKETVFIKRLLQTELPEKVSNIIADELFKQYVEVDEKIFNKELYLNEEQINCMLQNGMHVGMLGYNHLRYDMLKIEEQHNELQAAKEFVLGLGINESELTASYPWGAYNKNTLDILKKLKCKVAFTTEPAVADLDKHHSLELPRLDTNEIPKKAKSVTNKWFHIA